MTTLTKDESIVLQVAAKIAADLTNAACTAGVTSDTERIDTFNAYLDGVRTRLFTEHGFGSSGVAATFVQAFPQTQVAQDEYSAPFEPQQSYPQPAPQAAPVASGIRVKGTQHGPLPTWLFDAAAKAGVTEVYDNRDGLNDNPKRPWFKSTTGGKDAPAFWPPR